MSDVLKLVKPVEITLDEEACETAAEYLMQLPQMQGILTLALKKAIKHGATPDRPYTKLKVTAVLVAEE